MINLIYATHATSLDNEAGLASGHFDVDLSPTGERQAAELGARYREMNLAAVYYADQLRARKTVQIAFAGCELACIEEPRLRECDYGDFTRSPAAELIRQRRMRVETPYPGGESYRQTSHRIKVFLDDLKMRHAEEETVLIIGNRAVHYGLEHWLNDVPLEAAVTAPFAWQPGWHYRLDGTS